MARGIFSPKTRVFILLWVFLQDAVVSFGGKLFSIYLKSDNPAQATSDWPPNYLFGGGGIIGGIFILILGSSLDIKSYYWIVRCIQIVQIGLVVTLYNVHEFNWGELYFSSTYFLQGAAESMSRILSPVYIMSTICDRDIDEPIAFLLLVNTQLPIHLSSVFAQLLSINRMFLTVGVGVFGGIFFLVLFFSIFLPKSFQEGKEHENSEFVEFWHLQFENDCGWLRPCLTVCAVCILSQMSGFQLYQFYESWSFRLAQIHLQPGLDTSAISFFSLLLALITWTHEKLPYYLVISTGVLAVCSFLSGILLHGLEGGYGFPPYAPFSLRVIFTVAWSVGLGSLPETVGALVTPRNRRLGLFGLGRALSSAAALLSQASIPALIGLLHPFGVFWFYSVILLLGLLYISLGVLGQLRPRKYPQLPSSPPTLQEFITQV